MDAKLIKQLAALAGFDDCGISRATVEDSHIKFSRNWLSLGFNAGMSYLSANTDLRENPDKLLKNAKSVISLILNYYPSELLPSDDFSISKYAYSNDYHEVMRDKLKRLLNEIQSNYPEINARIFVDTAPVLERYFAMSSGLGFIGRNTCLINKNFGSWVFIGEIITDAESEYDNPLIENCGSCNECIKACPSGALSENGLNANRCISYHTIESKDVMPEEIGSKISNQIFGCDICQNVCPYNKDAKSSNRKEFRILPAIRDFNPNELIDISNREFNRRFAGTALLRAGRKKIISNYEVLKRKRN